MLVSQIAPESSDRILDVGCGTGTLAIQLKAAEPAANIFALDPDPAVAVDPVELMPGSARGFITVYSLQEKIEVVILQRQALN